MNCEQFNEALDDFLDGESVGAAQLQAHASSCPSCATQLEQAQSIAGAIEQLPVDPMRPEFAKRVIAEAARPRSLAAGRLVAGAFVATLVLSVITVILTGLSVQAPGTRISAGLPIVTMDTAVPSDVNLVFNARAPLDEVTLFITLPRGVELDGYSGQSQIEWQTALQSGQNILPLRLVARDGAGGQMVAELSDGEIRKVFRVHLEVAPG